MIRAESWTDPIRRLPRHFSVQDGATCEDILAAAPVPHPALRELLDVYVDGHLIYPQVRRLVRPKGTSRVVVCPTLHGGGRRGGMSKILSALAAIALAGVSLFTAGGGLGSLTGIAALGKGTLGARGLSALFGIAGSLLLQNLQQEPEDEKPPKPLGFASIQNNIEPTSPMLMWIGGPFRAAPQTIVAPWTEIDGDDQWTYWVGATPGEFVVDRWFSGDVDIDSIQDTEYQAVYDDTLPVIVPYTNGLLYSDDQENAAWTLSGGIDAFGAGSVANTLSITDPEGKKHANFIRLTTDAGSDTVRQDVLGHSPDQTSTFAVWIRAQTGGPTWFRLEIQDQDATGNYVRAWFDADNGVVGTAANGGNGTGAQADIADGGNSWWLLSLTGRPNTSGTDVRAFVSPASADGATSYTGDGTHGFYIWRAQLEAGSGSQPLVKTLDEPETGGTSGFSDTRVERKVNLDLSEWDYIKDDDDNDAILIEGTVEEAEPQWHRTETLNGPDWVRAEFVFTGGFYSRDVTGTGDNDAAFVVLRPRMRMFDEATSTYPEDNDGEGIYVNLPQLTIKAKTVNKALRIQLYIHWVTAYPAEAGNPWPPTSQDPTEIAGWVDVFEQPGTWDVDADFLSGSAAAGYDQWWWESDKKVHLYLLEADYPRGRYQVEYKRSWVFRWGNYDLATHTAEQGEFGITISDFFSAIEQPASSGNFYLPLYPENFQHHMVLTTVQSRWPEYFVNAGGPLTVFAVKVKNKDLGTVKVEGQRRIPDWRFGEWRPRRLTSNPASVFRDVLTSPHMAKSGDIEAAQIDDATLQEWHEWCELMGHSCRGVVQGKSATDVMRIAALCGHASPSWAPVYTVTMDRPRPEGVRGILSRRNAARMRTRDAFPELAHALRVNYVSAAEDYAVREVLVYAPGYSVDGAGDTEIATVFQRVEYDGIVEEHKAEERGDLDLRWQYYRGRLYICSQDMESLEHRKGKRVLWENDALGNQTVAGYITEIHINGSSEVTGLTLDEEVDVWDIGGGGSLYNPDDLYDPPNLYLPLQPSTPGCAIRLRDGTVVVAELTPTTEPSRTIEFATPLVVTMENLYGPTDLYNPDNLLYLNGGLLRIGDLVVVGVLDANDDIETDDIIVWDVRPTPGAAAEIVSVDYAEQEMYYPDAPANSNLVVDGSNLVYNGSNLVVSG